MHGKGMFRFCRGGYIEGLFEESTVSGKAAFFQKNGDCYIGNWKKGVADGKFFFISNSNKGCQNFQAQEGKMMKVDDVLIDARYISSAFKKLHQSQQVVAKQARRFARLAGTDGKGVFYGAQRNGVPDGLGLFCYHKAQASWGYFQGGQLNGIGRKHCVDQGYYLGQFSRGKFNGTGVIYNQDEDQFIMGNFKEGQLHQEHYCSNGTATENSYQLDRSGFPCSNRKVNDKIVEQPLFKFILLEDPQNQLMNIYNKQQEKINQVNSLSQLPSQKVEKSQIPQSQSGNYFQKHHQLNLNTLNLLNQQRLKSSNQIKTSYMIVLQKGKLIENKSNQNGNNLLETPALINQNSSSNHTHSTSINQIQNTSTSMIQSAPLINITQNPLTYNNASIYNIQNISSTANKNLQINVAAAKNQINDAQSIHSEQQLKSPKSPLKDPCRSLYMFLSPQKASTQSGPLSERTPTQIHSAQSLEFIPEKEQKKILKKEMYLSPPSRSAADLLRDPRKNKSVQKNGTASQTNKSTPCNQISNLKARQTKGKAILSPDQRPSLFLGHREKKIKQNSIGTLIQQKGQLATQNKSELCSKKQNSDIIQEEIQKDNQENSEKPIHILSEKNELPSNQQQPSKQQTTKQQQVTKTSLNPKKEAKISNEAKILLANKFLPFQSTENIQKYYQTRLVTKKGIKTNQQQQQVIRDESSKKKKNNSGLIKINNGEVSKGQSPIKQRDIMNNNNSEQQLNNENIDYSNKSIEPINISEKQAQQLLPEEVQIISMNSPIGEEKNLRKNSDSQLNNENALASDHFIEKQRNGEEIRFSISERIKQILQVQKNPLHPQGSLQQSKPKFSFKAMDKSPHLLNEGKKFMSPHLNHSSSSASSSQHHLVETYSEYQTKSMNKIKNINSENQSLSENTLAAQNSQEQSGSLDAEIYLMKGNKPISQKFDSSLEGRDYVRQTKQKISSHLSFQERINAIGQSIFKKEWNSATSSHSNRGQNSQISNNKMDLDKQQSEDNIIIKKFEDESKVNAISDLKLLKQREQEYHLSYDNVPQQANENQQNTNNMNANSNSNNHYKSTCQININDIWDNTNTNNNHNHQSNKCNDANNNHHLNNNNNDIHNSDSLEDSQTMERELEHAEVRNFEDELLKYQSLDHNKNHQTDNLEEEQEEELFLEIDQKQFDEDLFGFEKCFLRCDSDSELLNESFTNDQQQRKQIQEDELHWDNEQMPSFKSLLSQESIVNADDISPINKSNNISNNKKSRESIHFGEKYKPKLESIKENALEDKCTSPKRTDSQRHFQREPPNLDEIMYRLQFL